MNKTLVSKVLLSYLLFGFAAGCSNGSSEVAPRTEISPPPTTSTTTAATAATATTPGAFTPPAAAVSLKSVGTAQAAIDLTQNSGIVTIDVK